MENAPRFRTLQRLEATVITTIPVALRYKNVDHQSGARQLSHLKANDFVGASMEAKEGTVTPKGLTLEIESIMLEREGLW